MTVPTPRMAALVACPARRPSPAYLLASEPERSASLDIPQYRNTSPMQPTRCADWNRSGPTPNASRAQRRPRPGPESNEFIKNAHACPGEGYIASSTLSFQISQESLQATLVAIVGLPVAKVDDMPRSTNSR